MINLPLLTLDVVYVSCCITRLIVCSVITRRNEFMFVVKETTMDDTVVGNIFRKGRRGWS